jgi:diguanylate cyclase (GGDEF)-like protein/PAS domain S-box-containing protein
MKERKKNCWEVKKCGRQLGGKHSKEMGVCLASIHRELDGVHGGKNAGRACWLVAGTMSSGLVQGTFAREYKDCLTCDFYKLVKKEEGLDFKMTTGLEEMLLESENRYRMLFERAGDAIFILDAEGEKAGQIVAANQAAADMHGYTVDELSAMNIRDLDTPDAAKEAPGRIQRMLQGEWIKAEITHRRKDGTVFPVEISAGLLEFGNHKFILAFDRDISERKKIEEKLRLFSTVVEEAPDGVQITDPTGKILYSNKAVQKIYGVSSHEYYGRHVNEMNADPEFAEKVIIPQLREKGEWAGELTVKHRDGRTFPIWLTTALVKNSKGEPIAAVGIIRDMTERKKLQDLIVSAKKEWEESFDIINDAITIHDKDFNIIRANKTAKQMFGLSFGEIIGQKCYQLYHGSDCPPEGCASCLALKTGVLSTIEMFEPHLDKFLEIKAFPQVDENDRIFKLVHVVRDITDRKRMEKELHALSLTDELTGLTNRRGFFSLAEQQLKLSNRLKRRLFMLYIDVDNLKRINDAFGHKEGDLVLIETANILTECFREADVIARISGDEFVVILVGSADYIIEDITARLQNNLQNHNQSRNRSYELSLSVGIAYYDPECPCSLDELLSHGDKMMYEQKRLKRQS